jgi:hypothetical protein
LVFTPKGWYNLAQGAALGERPHSDHIQPEGLGQVVMSQPFRLRAAG